MLGMKSYRDVRITENGKRKAGRRRLLAEKNRGSKKANREVCRSERDGGGVLPSRLDPKFEEGSLAAVEIRVLRGSV
jgi:hypothetical protein